MIKLNYEFLKEHVEFLKEHVGHKIVCVMYGEQNIAIECESCNQVLMNYDINSKVESKRITQRRLRK